MGKKKPVNWASNPSEDPMYPFPPKQEEPEPTPPPKPPKRVTWGSIKSRYRDQGE